MRWIGDGSKLWRVRVDLVAADDDGNRALACARELDRLLTGDGSAGGGVGADEGLGVAHLPVVGLLFWVRADDVGAAAVLAVDTAQLAGSLHGVGPRLYDVTVIPDDAVAMPGDPAYRQCRTRRTGARSADRCPRSRVASGGL